MRQNKKYVSLKFRVGANYFDKCFYVTIYVGSLVIILVKKKVLMTLFGGGATFISVLLKYLSVVLSFFLKIQNV